MLYLAKIEFNTPSIASLPAPLYMEREVPGDEARPGHHT